MIPGPLVRVRYSCHECGINMREIPVPARGEDEDVRDWIATVQLHVGADHTAHSPNCRSTRCDLAVKASRDPELGIGHPDPKLH